jgi:dTDP-4-amino-4,6-dideoxygalactose transaminase
VSGRRPSAVEGGEGEQEALSGADGARAGTTGSATVRLGWPDVGEAELAEVAGVLETGMLTMGPKVAELEELLARACGVEHALAVSSGTAALHLAVLALGLEPGDEILVPAYTFPATANVVTLAGLEPVLVDVDPETMNVDPARVEVGPRTRAILAVHLFGRPARLDQLPDLPVLEDAAGALGARRGGEPCGGLGLLGCLSFHPRKIVTTGEGGAVTTNDERIADAVRQLRNHGWRSLQDADLPVPGLNYRLSDILCAVGIPQLRRLDELLEARTRIAAGYAERLSGLPLALPGADPGDVHGWQAYVVQVDERDAVLAALRAEGIEAQIGTFALPMLAAYRGQGDFPGAARVFERALALPFHTRLGDGDLDRVAEALTRLVSK